jgi:uncharacterized membrane protein YphA (DoxX/SURF4 family)
VVVNDDAARRVAVIVGVIFIGAGLVKFVFHGWELRAFRAFGLPYPSALEIFAGVLEVGGGALLIARVLVVPAAVLLAATMVVAIGASGIGHGDIVPSLTLAPALLAALLWLLARSTTRRG